MIMDPHRVMVLIEKEELPCPRDSPESRVAMTLKDEQSGSWRKAPDCREQISIGRPVDDEPCVGETGLAALHGHSYSAGR